MPRNQIVGLPALVARAWDTEAHPALVLAHVARVVSHIQVLILETLAYEFAHRLSLHVVEGDADRRQRELTDHCLVYHLLSLAVGVLANVYLVI